MYARVSKPPASAAPRVPGPERSRASPRPQPIVTVPLRTHSLAALVIQRRILGFRDITSEGAVPQLWVNLYLQDVLDHSAHLYLEDIFTYLHTHHEGAREDVVFDNVLGDHWNLEFGKDPNTFTVVTRADGSCGVHAIHAILHRDLSALTRNDYHAPDEFVTEVRTAIQTALTDREEIQKRIYARIIGEDSVAQAGFGPNLRGLLTPIEQQAHRDLDNEPVTPPSLDRDSLFSSGSNEYEKYEEDEQGYNDVDAVPSDAFGMEDELGLNEDDLGPSEDELGMQDERGPSEDELGMSDEDFGAEKEERESSASEAEQSEPELSEYEESSGYDSETMFTTVGARKQSKAKRRKKLDVRGAYRVRAKGKKFPINTSSGLRSLVDAAETGQPAANTHLLYKHKNEKSYTLLQQNTATGTRVAAGRYKPKGSGKGTNRITVMWPSVRGAHKGLSNVHTEMHLLYLRTGGDKTQIPNCLNGYTIIVDKPTCADCIEFVRLAKPDELRDSTTGIDEGGRAIFSNWTNPFDGERRNTKRKRG